MDFGLTLPSPLKVIPIKKIEDKIPTTQGRRKIPIKKIEDKNKKHVTFLKRRKGLFTKASELCILCGADVAIITFSQAGKVFSFGHPSTNVVIHRYLLHGSPASSEAKLDENQGTSMIGGQSLGRDRLGFWCDCNIEGLGLDELELFATSLGQLKSRVEGKLMNLKRQDPRQDDLADLKPINSSLVLQNVDHDFS